MTYTPPASIGGGFAVHMGLNSQYVGTNNLFSSGSTMAFDFGSMTGTSRISMGAFWMQGGSTVNFQGNVTMPADLFSYTLFSATNLYQNSGTWNASGVSVTDMFGKSLTYADSAMGAFMEQADFWGDKTYVFNGEAAMQYNGGEKPRMDTLAMDHLAPEYVDALMNKYPRKQGQTSFSDLDLAMFQDMGWTIRDSAWSNAPTAPEPGSAVLLVVGSLCVAWRRRR